MNLRAGEATCFINTMNKGYYYAFSLYVPPEFRRKGHATALLKKVVELAEKENKPMRLYASPFAERGPEREQLVKFYKKFGFRVTLRAESQTFMVYTPLKKRRKPHVDKRIRLRNTKAGVHA